MWALAAALLLAVRRSLLGRLDAVMYPEGRDQRRLLAHAGERLTHASTNSDIAEAVVAAALQGCGLKAASLLIADSEQSFAFVPLAGPCTLLPRDSAVAFVVESTRQPIVIGPGELSVCLPVVADERTTVGGGRRWCRSTCLRRRH